MKFYARLRNTNQLALFAFNSFRLLHNFRFIDVSAYRKKFTKLQDKCILKTISSRKFAWFFLNLLIYQPSAQITDRFLNKCEARKKNYTQFHIRLLDY